MLKRTHYLSEKFSNNILSLPLKYGGYGGYNMYKYMVHKQAKMFVHTLRADDNTGRKERNLLEYHQLENGRGKSFLEMQKEELEMLTDTWIRNLIRNMRKLGLWIKADHWKPDKKDETVMDILYEKEESQAWKEKMNLCRL